jgi:hypothetical protein
VHRIARDDDIYRKGAARLAAAICAMAHRDGDRIGAEAVPHRAAIAPALDLAHHTLPNIFAVALLSNVISLWSRQQIIGPGETDRKRWRGE